MTNLWPQMSRTVSYITERLQTNPSIQTGDLQSSSRMKIKFWIRKFTRRTIKKKENIKILSFKRIQSRIERKSYSFLYFAFHNFNAKRRIQEDLSLEERSYEDSDGDSEDYVDMSLKKNTCDKSLAAVLLKAKSEPESEPESDYESLYITADYREVCHGFTDQDSSIYEYCDF